MDVQTKRDGADYSNRSFVTRMDNLGNPDVIFIFGATNDNWAGSPMGEYKYDDDIQPSDLWQFRPALARMLQWMKEHYASSDIYFMLNDILKDDINTSVRTLCNRYGIKLIELKDIDKISGHPSVKGMQQIADQVVSNMEQP